MTEYQKIAIGLLGLTHPEMFIPGRRRAGIADERPPANKPNPGGRARRIVRALRFTFAALGSGSGIVGLADNGQVVRDLTERAKALYGAD